jgi:hypothetical protein
MSTDATVARAGGHVRNLDGLPEAQALAGDIKPAGDQRNRGASEKQSSEDFASRASDRDFGA